MWVGCKYFYKKIKLKKFFIVFEKKFLSLGCLILIFVGCRNYMFIEWNWEIVFVFIVVDKK